MYNRRGGVCPPIKYSSGVLHFDLETRNQQTFPLLDTFLYAAIILSSSSRFVCSVHVFLYYIFPLPFFITYIHHTTPHSTIQRKL